MRFGVLPVTVLVLASHWRTGNWMSLLLGLHTAENTCNKARMTLPEYLLFLLVAGVISAILGASKRSNFQYAEAASVSQRNTIHL